MAQTLKLVVRRPAVTNGYTREVMALHVYDSSGDIAPQFEMMCEAIYCDIQSAEGSGACNLEWIRKVESGELDLADVDGNAWVAYITRDKVWFEGLYSQGEGGQVSFEQYKLAVQTYVRFLADPQRRPIEVEFPA
ncbi:MAG: hypothetical protein AB1666_09310, partial [Pseudomonadota bacterium]